LGEFKDRCNGTSTCCNNGATAVYIASLDSKGSLWQQEKVSYTSCVLGSIIRLPFVFGRSANTTNDDYEKGLRAGFEEINNAGGIRGRKVKLKSHPSYGNATKLRRWLNHLKSENVMGFVGLDRTDDNVILEFAAMKTIPIIGTFSGVTALREPYNQYLVNLRASLVDQAAAILDTIKQHGLQSTLVVYEGNSTYWKQAVTGIIGYAKVLQFSIPETVTIEQLVPTLLKTTYHAVVIFADAQVVKKITSVVSLYSSNSTTFSAYDTEQPNTDYVAQAVPSVQNAYTEGYMTAQLIGLSLKQATNDSVREFIESMYTLSVFSINGVRLGPISGTCTKANTFCDCNQLTHHVPVIGKKTTTLQFTSCGVSLALPPVQDIAGAVALLVVLFLVIIFAIAFSIIVTLVLIWWCRRSHASLKNAPRTGEMVLAFTDVQNSTKLWSNLGNDMAKALKIHNMVIRKLIEQYEGYEVKTQGDSFMVCFEDPIRAVMWALHVQKELVQQRWDPVLTRAFDCRIEFNESEQIVFNGLRVRMGLHFGYAERMYDKVTKRYDYFGSTVNCAARVESEAKGGQVFVSGALFDAIAETMEMVDHFQYSVLWEGSPGDQVTLLEPEQIMITTSPKVGSASLGEQILYRRVGDFQLKGIEGHVTIYELMCESLYLRSYDPPKSSATGTPSHQRSYKNVKFADDMESDRISNISIQIDEYLPRALLEIYVIMHCDDEQDKIFVELKPC
jgi:class 3 adenylate cyclase